MQKQDFIKGDFKTLTLIGMSGVGKSHLATLLERSDGWHHLSVDYLIGKYYIADHIEDADQITKDNITPIADFMGLLGNPEKGGSPFETIKRKQRLYHDAEVLASQALPSFAKQAKSQGLSGLINDTTGSFCELDYPELPSIIAEDSLIIYIEASERDREAILARAITYPKPMFYPKGLLDKLVDDFTAENDLEDYNGIDPKEFFDYAYPKLFDQRLPKYKSIADNHGCTISSDAIKLVENAGDFISLIEANL